MKTYFQYNSDPNYPSYRWNVTQTKDVRPDGLRDFWQIGSGAQKEVNSFIKFVDRLRKQNSELSVRDVKLLWAVFIAGVNISNDDWWRANANPEKPNPRLKIHDPYATRHEK